MYLRHLKVRSQVVRAKRGVYRATILSCLVVGSIAHAQFEMDDQGDAEEAVKKPKKEKIAREKKARAPKVAKQKGEKPAVELQQITLTGTLEKKETERDGKQKVSYALTCDDGTKVRLPKTEGVNLDEFVGQAVMVSGSGTASEKDGKKRVSLKKIAQVTPSEGGGADEDGEEAANDDGME